MLVSATEYDVTQEPSGFHLVYDYSPCDAFYNSTHNVGAPVYTFDSYVTEAHMIGTCSRCQEQSISETYDPMITFCGFALNMKETDLTVGYVLDNKSIEKYVSEGHTFNYGLVAFVPKEATAQPLSVENNEIKVNSPTNTMFADLSKLSTTIYSCVDFIIKGIPNQPVSLIMCMYVFDGTDIGYICGTRPYNYETGVASDVEDQPG